MSDNINNILKDIFEEEAKRHKNFVAYVQDAIQEADVYHALIQEKKEEMLYNEAKTPVKKAKKKAIKIPKQDLFNLGLGGMLLLLQKQTDEITFKDLVNKFQKDKEMEKDLYKLMRKIAEKERIGYKDRDESKKVEAAVKQVIGRYKTYSDAQWAKMFAGITSGEDLLQYAKKWHVSLIDIANKIKTGDDLERYLEIPLKEAIRTQLEEMGTKIPNKEWDALKLNELHQKFGKTLSEHLGNITDPVTVFNRLMAHPDGKKFVQRFVTSVTPHADAVDRTLSAAEKTIGTGFGGTYLPGKDNKNVKILEARRITIQFLAAELFMQALIALVPDEQYKEEYIVEGLWSFAKSLIGGMAKKISAFKRVSSMHSNKILNFRNVVSSAQSFVNFINVIFRTPGVATDGLSNLNKQPTASKFQQLPELLANNKLDLLATHKMDAAINTFLKASGKDASGNPIIPAVMDIMTETMASMGLKPSAGVKARQWFDKRRAQNKADEFDEFKAIDKKPPVAPTPAPGTKPAPLAPGEIPNVEDINTQEIINKVFGE